MSIGTVAELKNASAFLGPDGEMSRRIAEHDWSSTLGPISAWPVSLKTTVGILIRSPLPMALMWGEDGVMIYNDAYAIVAGSRDPTLLGSKVRQGWPETAEFNDHVMRIVLAGGALAYRDQAFVLHRSAEPEPAWMNLDYSPVIDETGRPGGVIAVVVETTARVQAQAALRASEGRLRFLDDLGRATAKLSDANEILSTTTRMVGEHLGVSVCAYADMDENQDGFTIRGDWNAPGSRSIVGHYRLAGFGELAVKNLSAGLPLVVNDVVKELAPHEAATFQNIGVAATLCMPLVKDGRLTGLMAIHDQAPRLWSANELALVREVTERSWAHVERIRSAAELRSSEENFRTLAGAMPEHVWTASPEGQLNWFNDAVYAYTGAQSGELDGDDWTRVVHPDDLPVAATTWGVSVDTGVRYQVEFRLRRADGAYRWHIARAAPIWGDFGLVVRWVGTNTDIQDQKEVAQALAELNASLQEQEAFQRAITHAAPECVKIVGADGGLLQMNPAGLRMIEATEFASVFGAETSSLIAPEHRQAWLANHRRILQGESLNWEFDIVGLHGARRSMESHAVPLRLPDGSVAQLAVTRDVTARKAAEEHLKLMVLELNHRVKNNLATVQAIAVQTFKGTGDPAAARESFQRRLSALAAAHDVLTREQWDGAGVAEIARGVLDALEGGGQRLELDGPKVRLTPKAALALSMAFHELGTNALKYGAFSTLGGRVRLTWVTDPAASDRLSLLWREDGGPPVLVPKTRGFGSRLLERGLAAELGGEVVMEFDAAGLVCRISGTMLG